MIHEGTVMRECPECKHEAMQDFAFSDVDLEYVSVQLRCGECKSEWSMFFSDEREKEDRELSFTDAVKIVLNGRTVPDNLLN